LPIADLGLRIADLGLRIADLGLRIGDWGSQRTIMPQEDLAGRSDPDLVHAVADGDQAAFAELLRRYEAPILTFCYSFTRDRELAEDLAQETFLRVFRNAGRYQPIAKFSTWLYKIAVNLCINEMKRMHLRPRLTLDEPAGPDPEGSRVVERLVFTGQPPVNEAEQRELQEMIRRAIDHLPEDQRTTLVLVEYHHLPYQDVAEVLGVTVSAIKMRVKRARESLREILKVLKTQG
jgi:RNA polymerase sigma-70 factor (ECF subfamily)